MVARPDLPAQVTVDLCGVPITPWTERQVVTHVMTELARHDRARGGWIVTPNVDILRKIVRDPGIAALVRPASLMVADGMPLVWAAAIERTPLPERVTGASLLERLCAAAAEHQRRVYLLGGADGVADEAVRRLTARYPGLVAAGWSPPFRERVVAEDIAAMRTRVRAFDADVVFCGFGFPKQEYIIAELVPDFPDTWFVGCGASVTFAAGHIPRAPGWMQRFGLEWVHRLAQEPTRMFRRYIAEDLPFALRLLFGSLWRRIHS